MKIKLDNETNEMTSSSQFKNIDGTDYLFRFRDYQSPKNPQQLEVINLTDEKVEKIIDFPLEGPNSFNELVNFHVHDFDSIFFHNEAFPLTFYLTDTSKNLKQKWEIEDMEIGAGWSSNASPFLIEDKFYFCSISTQSFYPDDQDYIDYKFLSYLNLNNGKIKEVSSIDYPKIFKENYKNGKWYPWSGKPYFHYYNENIFVGFNMSPEITSIKQGKTENINLEISFAKLAEAVSIDINDFASNQLHLIGSPQLGKMVYDPYRDKLIRLYKHPIEIDESEDRSNVYYRSRFSLLFFELNGKLAAEIELPKNTFNPSIIIPTEKGLLINTDNPFNPKNNENFLEFDHISFNDMQ
ncbi:hypothetical protein QYS49_38505 [Marivirga salinae]|uniref:DUF4221 domain-containing protein n=1 Tax=Marivirga salinarum TaxID=3059078 RepID=A0AA51NAP6_9BACT|nr:DUF4221 family protein [Marivirga sp. BDSF4-3]WMN11480.1 hypothetical protein QYS49_38505 [Marivirga sp. BDSF4-3]